MPKKRVDLTKAKTRAASTDSAQSLFNSQLENQTFIELDLIQDRISGDTRTLNDSHVEELMSSIAALGLITPLTVDSRYRLLAGGHRKEALIKLLEESPNRFRELFESGIPVRVMNIDSEVDIVDAIQIEVEENTQRKNYTPSEIREAARKLEDSGYQKLKGRPKKGQKSLNRELMNVFRLSRRRITEILNEKDDASNDNDRVSDHAKRFLKQAIKFQSSIPDTDDATIHKIERDLNRVIKNLYVLMEDEI